MQTEGADQKVTSIASAAASNNVMPANRKVDRERIITLMVQLLNLEQVFFNRNFSHEF